MRRGILVFAVLVLVATLALWIAARIERSPLARSARRPHVPMVIAGRDFGLADESPTRARVDDGTATVRCRYEGDGDPGELGAIGAETEMVQEGGELSLALPAGAWSVVWIRQTTEDRWTTVTLASLTAEAGETYTCTLVDGGWELRGTVRNLDGRPVAGALVLGCGRFVETGEDGTFRAVVRSGACTARARHVDGVLGRTGEGVPVDPFHARNVELVVDDAPIAGMGLAFRVTDAGVRVHTVHAGTPAEEAGVVEGDLIVSVDGTPTAGLDEDAFIALGTGREGSRVELVVEHDGERETIAFYRERIASVGDDEDLLP